MAMAHRTVAHERRMRTCQLRVVDMTGIVGYYTLLAMPLKVAQHNVPGAITNEAHIANRRRNRARLGALKKPAR